MHSCCPPPNDNIVDYEFKPKLGTGDLPELTVNLTHLDFQAGASFWDRQIPDYMDLLYAENVGEKEGLFDSMTKGDWRFLERSQRYRNRKSKEVIYVNKYLELRDRFSDTLHPLAEQIALELSERTITIHQFVRQMADLIQLSHVTMWQLGAGGYNRIDQRAVDQLTTTIEEQYEYLKNYANDILHRNRPDTTLSYQRGPITYRGVRNRNIMFMESATASAERGRMTTYTPFFERLPQYPGDGNQICLTRCRCHWRIIYPRNVVSYLHAYWIARNDARTCVTCRGNSRRWNPLTVLRF